MAQIFHRSFNTLSKGSIFGGVFLLIGLSWAWAKFVRSDYVTGVGVARRQPVPFSHQHQPINGNKGWSWCKPSRLRGGRIVRLAIGDAGTSGKQPGAGAGPRILANAATATGKQKGAADERVALTAATVYLSYVDLGEWHSVAGLSIAAAKAILIVLFFMHVLHGARLIWVMAISGLFWLGILLTFTLMDYLTRSWLAY